MLVLWICRALLFIIHVFWTFLLFLKRKIKRYKRRNFKFEAIDGPHHLALLIGKNEVFSLKTIADFIIWAANSGTAHITLYDITGLLKKNEEKLVSIVNEIKKNSSVDIKWSHKSYSNGYYDEMKYKIKVYILTPYDGKPKIISSIKEMCLKDSVDTINPNSLTVDSINEYFNKVYLHIPEPNLIVYFGELCSYQGFPPWHIRYTEFLNLDNITSLTKIDFNNLLYRYKKCEQRYGK